MASNMHSAHGVVVVFLLNQSSPVMITIVLNIYQITFLCRKYIYLQDYTNACQMHELWPTGPKSFINMRAEPSLGVLDYSQDHEMISLVQTFNYTVFGECDDPG